MNTEILKRNFGKKAAAFGLVGLSVASVFAAGCSNEKTATTAATNTSSGVGTVTIDSDEIVFGPKAQEALDKAAKAALARAAAGISTSTTAPTETTTVVETAKVYFAGIPVPSNLSEIGTAKMNNSFPEEKWVNPVYNSLTADADHNWEGIGPHYPIAFKNIDPNAARVSTHGNVGEVVLVSDKGGMVMISFMQEYTNQKDGAWGKDQNGDPIKGNWEMQYNFHALAPNQEISVVDPDTGKQLLWPDGSPVIYRANDQGIASFEVPATYGECGNGNDVRFGLMFSMPASITGTQATEVKIERGPNDHPELTGENPLPIGVIKPMVPGE